MIDNLKSRELREKTRSNFIKNNIKKDNSCLVISINIPYDSYFDSLKNKLLKEARRIVDLRLYYKEIQIFKYKMLEDQKVIFMAIDGNPQEIKRLMIDIENNNIAGRFFDLDVFDHKGHQLSRKKFNHPFRKCFICNQNAKICIRKRKHTKKEIYSFIDLKTRKIENELKKSKNEFADKIKEIVYFSLINELKTTPKPGLVDKTGIDSHKDMDFKLFKRSTEAITPYFKKFVLLGVETDLPDDQMLEEIRKIGKEVEKTMFKVTNGINTQKGLIFSLGLITTAVGVFYKKGFPDHNKTVYENLSLIVSKWTEGIVERELSSFDNRGQLTNGEKVYKQYGISGARGEAAIGYQTAISYGLPELNKALKLGFSINDACIQALINLMVFTEDSNIVYRSGIDTLKEIQLLSRNAIRAGGIYTSYGWEKIYKLIDYIETVGTSPGGSADLLAVTIFLYKLDKDNYILYSK
ncbi:MAG: triphosphoribosyl-dephospho-CoA synthase [Halanaerobiales bacterium]